jgi:DNA-directed RNA polymerase specialized sigma54-like protein
MLNDDGYLTEPIEEIARNLSATAGRADDVDDVLAFIQTRSILASARAASRNASSCSSRSSTRRHQAASSR